MEGKGHCRVGGGVGDAGGGGVYSRRHVPTSGMRRRGAVREGREAVCAGPLPALFHMRLTGGCVSAAGGNAEPRFRQCIVASHHSMPQRTADRGVDAPRISVLTSKEIFPKAYACADADLYRRKLRRARQCCEPC